MNGKIYMITNSANSLAYIGATKRPVADRFKDHCKLLESSKYLLIHQEMKKIGIEKFSYRVLEEGLKTRGALLEREIFWIRKYQTISPFGYNKMLGNFRPDLYENNENIIELYKSGKSMRFIGLAYKASKRSIGMILRRFNVHIRSKEESLPLCRSLIEKTALAELVELGLSGSKISKILGFHVRAINRAIHRFNLKRK